MFSTKTTSYEFCFERNPYWLITPNRMTGIWCLSNCVNQTIVEKQILELNFVSCNTSLLGPFPDSIDHQSVRVWQSEIIKAWDSCIALHCYESIRLLRKFSTTHGEESFPFGKSVNNKSILRFTGNISIDHFYIKYYCRVRHVLYTFHTRLRLKTPFTTSIANRKLRVLI